MLKTKLTFSKKQQGFTLLEIMLVLVLMAILVSSISLSFNVSSPKSLAEKEAKRFYAVYTLAAEYSLLNNLQLGIVVSDNQYEFVGFDGKRWSPLADEPLFEPHELPQEFILQLTLGDIPWLDEEDDLEGGLFSKDDEDEEFSNNADGDADSDHDSEAEIDNEEKRKKIIPQLYIFSSGDITPFEVTFVYYEEYSDDAPVGYTVSGEHALPIKVDGPFEDIELD